MDFWGVLGVASLSFSKKDEKDHKAPHRPFRFLGGLAPPIRRYIRDISGALRELWGSSKKGAKKKRRREEEQKRRREEDEKNRITEEEKK